MMLNKGYESGGRRKNFLFNVSIKLGVSNLAVDNKIKNKRRTQYIVKGYG